MEKGLDDVPTGLAVPSAFPLAAQGSLDVVDRLGFEKGVEVDALEGVALALVGNGGIENAGATFLDQGNDGHGLSVGEGTGPPSRRRALEGACDRMTAMQM